MDLSSLMGQAGWLIHYWTEQYVNGLKISKMGLLVRCKRVTVWGSLKISQSSSTIYK